jgi:hypothetical protein
MGMLVFILCAVIICHCIILISFGIEKYKPGTIPYSDAIMCNYNYTPYGTGSYCCCMVMTILLLIYLFKYIGIDDNDS